MEIDRLSEESPSAVTFLCANETIGQFHSVLADDDDGSSGFPDTRAVVVQTSVRSCKCLLCNKVSNNAPNTFDCCSHLVRYITTRAVDINGSEYGEDEIDDFSCVTDFTAVGAKKAFHAPSPQQVKVTQEYFMNGMGSLTTDTLKPAIHACKCTDVPCSCGARCGKCNAPWGLETLPKPIVLYTEKIAFEIKVCSLWCSDLIHCGNEYIWDGDDCAIMRSGTTSSVAIPWSFAQSILHMVFDTRFTVHSFYNVVCKNYQMSESKIPFMSKSSLQNIVWEIISSWKVDFQDCFTCPCCGSFSKADIIIMDGKRFGCKKSKAPVASLSQQKPSSSSSSSSSSSLPARKGKKGKKGWEFKDRVLIADTSTRLWLLRYCNAGRSSVAGEPLKDKVMLAR
jgi:hypothetical protein